MGTEKSLDCLNSSLSSLYAHWPDASWAFSLTRTPVPAPSASSPEDPFHGAIPAHPGQVCTGSSRCGPTSAEQRGRGKAHLPHPAPPEPAQHPVGILGKNRAQEGVSSPCFCVTSLKLGAVTCLHQRESKNPHQCFNYLLKMRQLHLK